MDINEAFAHTFSALLGKSDEKPKLEDFKDYLAEYMLPLAKRKSAISGKEVTLVSNDYCKSARFISQDEIRENKFEPLNINEIKDIDSILGAIGERMEYAGNKALGNSAFFKDVDFCVDSFYVTNSSNIQESKYIDHSWFIRGNSECIFGSGWMGESKQIMRSVAAYNITRCFVHHLSCFYFIHL